MISDQSLESTMKFIECNRKKELREKRINTLTLTALKNTHKSSVKLQLACYYCFSNTLVSYTET